MNKKELFYSLADLLGRCAPQRGMSILCYHSIDDSESRISLALERFALHMQLLHELGYRTIRLGELAARLGAGQPLPARTVAITFDDGFANLADAAPAMQAYGFVGTVFVIGAMAGQTIRWRDREGWLPRLPLLGWGQIAELQRAGFEIGAHSLSHRYLTRLPDDELREEVGGSKALLEDKLGAPVTTFCYPYGDHDARVVGAVAGAGYAGACTTLPTRLGAGADRFALPRLYIARDTTAPIFKAYLTPGATLGFQVVSAVRSRRAGHQPWYVPDPRCTDSTGTIVPGALAEEPGM